MTLEYILEMENGKDVCGIQIRFSEKSGMIFGESPDIRGLLLVGPTEEDIEAKAPNAIALMLAMGGLEKPLLERLHDKALLRMHDDIHKIMEARAIDMKARHRAAQSKG